MNADDEGTPPSTLLRLLWRSRTRYALRPGPRPRVTADDIVTTAVQLADESGLQGVSMRNVAQVLGVKVMTLYSHVPGKDAVSALMVDSVHGDFRFDPQPGAPVERTLRRLLEENYRMLLQHPWLLEMHTEQPPMGPGTLSKYEIELTALAPLGLTDQTMDAVLTFLLDFARGAAGDHVRRLRSRVDNVEWWESVQPYLAEYVQPDEFPLATRVGSAAGAELGGAYNAEAAYRFGSDLVVDAVARLARPLKR
ncbi:MULTISPECIES: TetR/AcrR family transcriptional regulator [Microbacterium]|uniref:TetR/AcrR family transcriptional regulator n=1 Tax=Microbacterium TaxID=33882 RepID=UPI0014306557|nr:MULTISPECIES: TetR/AcrR family transcriptional regulator [Microbacterium]MCK6068210.1 TetR/AcrR family transcriptional regulator [Microbacterium sp. EYE_512]